jgi:hypothetical protein
MSSFASPNITRLRLRCRCSSKYNELSKFWMMSYRAPDSPNSCLSHFGHWVLLHWEITKSLVTCGDRLYDKSFVWESIVTDIVVYRQSDFGLTL